MDVEFCQPPKSGAAAAPFFSPPLRRFFARRRYPCIRSTVFFSAFFSPFFCSASAVCYAVMLILNKKARGVDGMENSLLQMLSATVTVFLLLLCKGGLAMSVTATSWPWILLLGIVNTGFGCWCYFSALGALPVQTVAVCGYLEPLSAVIFSALLLHERLTAPQLLGAALIIGGALFAECVHPKHKTVKKVTA